MPTRLRAWKSLPDRDFVSTFRSVLFRKLVIGRKKTCKLTTELCG